MISIKANYKPLKLMKFNLDYKYSLIKVLARDKAYLVLKEFGNIVLIIHPCIKT